MFDQFRKESASITAAYRYPCHPIHGLVHYKIDSECRKPRPCMFFCAREDLGVNLGASIVIGGSVSDIIGARDASISERWLFVDRGKEFVEVDESDTSYTLSISRLKHVLLLLERRS